MEYHSSTPGDHSAHNTFHHYPRLPLEIRLKILDHAMERRDVDFSILANKSAFYSEDNTFLIIMLRPRTPVPPFLHINYESREYLLKNYKLLHDKDGNALPLGYFNINIDTIHFGIYDEMAVFNEDACRSAVNSRQIYNSTGHFGLANFIKGPQDLKELQRIVVGPRFMTLYGLFTDFIGGSVLAVLFRNEVGTFTTGPGVKVFVIVDMVTQKY